jgi:hypothetical protein
MNNTSTLTEIAAILMAATLVVGGTLAAASAQSVFPLPNIGAQNDGKGGNGGGGVHPGGGGGGGGHPGGGGGGHPGGGNGGNGGGVHPGGGNGGGGGGGDHGKGGGGGDHGKGGGGGNGGDGNGGSTLQSCQQTFTSVLSQKQIDEFEAAALSVFPSPPQKLTVVDLCKILTTGTMTEQLMNRILSGAQSIDVYTGLSLKSRLVEIGIKFAPPIEGWYCWRVVEKYNICSTHISNFFFLFDIILKITVIKNITILIGHL